MGTTKLTWEETKEIASRLDEILYNNFHDAIYSVICQRESSEQVEVSDEDIMEIIKLLKKIL